MDQAPSIPTETPLVDDPEPLGQVPSSEVQLLEPPCAAGATLVETLAVTETLTAVGTLTGEPLVVGTVAETTETSERPQAAEE